MPAPLKIPNYLERNIRETTILTGDVAAAATTLAVDNVSGFAANDYIIIGPPGTEKCELRQVSGAPTTTIAVTATSYPHYIDQPVTKLFGNKIKVFYAADVDGNAPDVSAFSNLLGTYAIDVDQPDTLVEDAAGGSNRWYRFSYYNETTTTSTDLSQSPAVRGADFANYCSIQEILLASGMANNTFISFATVDEKRQAAQRMIDGKLTGIYTVPFADPIPSTVVNLAIRLSSGLLLMGYSLTYDEGKKKYADALTELETIQLRQQAILDQSGTTLANNTDVGGFSMYPDETTDGAEFEDGGPAFVLGTRY